MQLSFRLLICLFTIQLTLAVPLTETLSFPSVTLDAGVVVGTATTLPLPGAIPVNKFLGIPFAAPPERFAAPQPPKSWSTPFNATQLKPTCIQTFIYPKSFHDFIESLANNPAPVESEDCLYLNIFAPSTPPPPDGRAVLFFIYGGNFQSGSASLVDGAAFSAYEDVVFVAANYRTNLFGFPPTTQTASHQNLGFLDQRLALTWVQTNIHAFGGSPSKVTIVGQSAGAWSVDNLLASFPTSPPFRAGATMSGQYTFLTPGEVNTTKYYWPQLLHATNCTSTGLSCVAHIPAATLRSIIEHEQLLFWPEVDDVTMVAHPIRARLSGNFAAVPLLTGTVADEGSVNTFSQNNFTEWAGQQFGLVPALYEDVVKAYPREEGESDAHLIARVFSDYYMLCPQSLQALLTSKTSTPTWRYYFNVTAPPNFLPPAYPNLGTYHGLDVAMLFANRAGNYTAVTLDETAPEVAQLAWLRRTYGAFVRNPAAGPGWNEVGSVARDDLVSQNPGAGPRGVMPAPADLDLGVIGGGGGGVAGVELARREVTDSKCRVFMPLYRALAQARGDAFPF